MRARRFPALDASAVASPVFAVLILSHSHDWSEIFFNIFLDVRAIFILCLCFALNKPEIPCVIKFFQSSCDYHWYRTQFTAGSVLKNPDNLIWFWNRWSHWRTALIRFWKTPSDSLLGLNPNYIFLARLMPHLLIFFPGLKPLPLNFLNPNKMTVPRDRFVNFWFQY